MAKFAGVVYDPPDPKLPYLGVVFTELKVDAVAFPTREEAQEHVNNIAASLAAKDE